MDCLHCVEIFWICLLVSFTKFLHFIYFLKQNGGWVPFISWDLFGFSTGDFIIWTILLMGSVHCLNFLIIHSMWPLYALFLTKIPAGFISFCEICLWLSLNLLFLDNSYENYWVVFIFWKFIYICCLINFVCILKNTF